MTTKLHALKRKLETLRRTRWRVRWSSALAAFAIAALWLLAVMFLIDFGFQLGIAERLVLLALAGATTVWAFSRWSLPLLDSKESLVDVALLVERQHQIDSDLVAALQFESGDAMKWGSRQLEHAVIDRVAQRAGNLNVFEGLPREQFVRRMTTLGITVAIFATAVVMFPDYASTFFNRLAMGSQHYPTQTVMQTLVINDQVVLQRSENRSSHPQEVRCAQAAPLEILLLCSGELPDAAKANLRSLSAGVKRPLKLQRLAAEERKHRVEQGRSLIQAAQQDPAQDVTGPWATQLATLLRFDVEPAIPLLPELREHRDATLAKLLENVDQALAQWPRKSSTAVSGTALYRGQLERHVDKLEYQIFAGDAWTDPSIIDLIPLPQIEPHLTVSPPEYASAWQAPDAESYSRHLSVLEGSRIAVDLVVTNGKSLQDAWLLVKTEDGVDRFPLEAQDEQQQEWSLPTAGTPFHRLSQPLRYEIQVTDVDGLHLDAPMVGYVRIQADRPPSATVSVVHRLVVPQATPVISYRVNDDFGIRRIVLQTVVERDRKASGSTTSSADAESDTSDSVTSVAENAGAADLVIYDGSDPIPAHQLPRNGQYRAELGKLDLQPEDRLILVLSVEDYRGAEPGKIFEAEPLVLEVADASTVEAAILEADERSEEQLSDIIKRQLGIGESP